MSRLPIILPNCHGNLPMSWHDSHGGKRSKTFYITPGNHFLHMEMGGLVSVGLHCRGSPPWDQLTRLVACLDLHSSSWWNKILLSCPCHIPFSRAQHCWVTRAAGAERLPACWTGVLVTGVHPVPRFRCCCAHTNVALDGEKLTSVCSEKVVLNSHIIKSEWICAVSLPPRSWRGFLEKWTAMMWSSYLFFHPGHHSQKYFGSVSSGLFYFIGNLRGKGFARR